MNISKLGAQTISQRLVVHVSTTEISSLPVTVDLSYDTTDPYAVTLSFLTSERPVAWTFGRELLAAGLTEPTGDGDVHIWSCLDQEGDAVVTVELCSPKGDALIDIALDDAVDFVDRMHTLVAQGTESDLLDVEATISAILSSENV